ncbi:ferritin [Patescibacteria group bacterium]
MKINKKMETAINKQINAELYSAYIYLSMSAYFEAENLGGFAHWMRLQAQEEVEHAMKFYKYIFERGGNVSLMAIDKPKLSWQSALAVFEEAYKHEQKVTKMIDNLVDLARKDSDKASESFLEWFIDEQVEEEASADEIVQQLKLIKGNTNGLFMMNEKLGKRKGE